MVDHGALTTAGDISATLAAIHQRLLHLEQQNFSSFGDTNLPDGAREYDATHKGFRRYNSSTGLWTKDVDNLTEDTAPDQYADFIPIYDASGAVWKKVKPDNLINARVSFVSATIMTSTASSSDTVLGTTHPLSLTVPVKSGEVVFVCPSFSWSAALTGKTMQWKIQRNSATNLFTWQMTPSLVASSEGKAQMASTLFVDVSPPVGNVNYRIVWSSMDNSTTMYSRWGYLAVIVVRAS